MPISRGYTRDMSALLVFCFFALGAIVASFVGVVAGRLYTGEGFLRGRSRCDACGETLSPLALVPIISYFAFCGRSICCGARLSVRGPLTEILLGALFLEAYLTLGLTLALLFFLISLSLLLSLVLYDLAHQILPTPLLVPFVVASGITGYFQASSPSESLTSCATAVLIAGSLLLIHFLSRGRAMGFADAPLALGLALLVGNAALPGFIFSFWIGALFGIAVLLVRPAGSRMGIEVPFAPYLAAGFLLAYFTQWNPFISLVASH